MLSHDTESHLRLVGGTDYERLRLDIRVEYRGVLFERIFENNHPQETTRRLEVGFVEQWTEENMKNSMLYRILCTDSKNPQSERIPKNSREWEVAELVAASIIQWLPSSVGCRFLCEAFKRGGGKIDFTLPNY